MNTKPMNRRAREAWRRQHPLPAVHGGGRRPGRILPSQDGQRRRRRDDPCRTDVPRRDMELVFNFTRHADHYPRTPPRIALPTTNVRDYSENGGSGLGLTRPRRPPRTTTPGPRRDRRQAGNRSYRSINHQYTQTCRTQRGLSVPKSYDCSTSRKHTRSENRGRRPS